MHAGAVDTAKLQLADAKQQIARMEAHLFKVVPRVGRAPVPVLFCFGLAAVSVLLCYSCASTYTTRSLLA